MDIAPELLEKIQESFRDGYTHNKNIASIVSKVGAGKGTGADSAAFATEVGNELKRAVSENVQPDNLPDERMYYNIAEKVFPPLLKKNHELINAVSKEVAKTTAQKAGLNLNGVDVPMDKNKIEGIVKHASKGEKYKSVKKSTENSLVNYSQAVNDESVKRNAEFVSDSGVKAYIIRTTTGKCCEWCTNIAGKYEYGQEPRDIYRRHANCDCVVEYVVDGKSQNVHTKQWATKEEIEARKNIEPPKPTKEDVEKLKNLGVENGRGSGIIKAGDKVGETVAGRFSDKFEKSRVINEAINAPKPVYSEDLREAYKNVKPKEGFYDVVIHGSQYYAEYEGKYNLDADTLATIIRGRKDYHMEDIRLLSCSAGMVDEKGNCLAQQVANKLNVNVLAPIDTLNIYSTGKLTIGDSSIDEENGFKLFTFEKGDE